MINVSEIFNIEYSRKNNKKEIYKKIFEQFSRKIRCTVELGGKTVMLRVPFVVFGYPTFDRSRACVYLKRQLELSGFSVQSISTIDLCVTWSSPRKDKPVEARNDDDGIPSFINLKQMANKYRNGA